MGEVVYVSRVAITRKRGPLREAEVPGAQRTVTFGVHSAVADHYARMDQGASFCRQVVGGADEEVVGGDDI